MSHHDLKCIEPFFTQVVNGKKMFEVRKDDRIPSFQEGDTATLRAFNPIKKTFDGRFVMIRIEYVLRESRYLRKGYCAFGFTNLLDNPSVQRERAPRRF